MDLLSSVSLLLEIRRKLFTGTLQQFAAKPLLMFTVKIHRSSANFAVKVKQTTELNKPTVFCLPFARNSPQIIHRYTAAIRSKTITSLY